MMLCMLLVTACMAYGQNIIDDYAPHSKRGELPPAWLKNKVTQSQYDSLALLSKYYAVNYDFFKRRTLTKADINLYVSRIKELLSEKQLKRLKQHGNDTCYFDTYRSPENLKPFMMSANADGSKKMKYIAYSEIDGYDAHVMIEVKVSKDKNGDPVFSRFKMVPYSLSGLKVELEGMSLRSDGRRSLSITANGVYNKQSLMSEFSICGLLKFEDAMGNRHTELVQRSFYLVTE